MSERTGRPLILVRKKPVEEYPQGDITGKVSEYPSQDISETVPATRFSGENFSNKCRDLQPAGGTLSEVSHPSHADPDVAAALVQIEAEIRSGQISSGPILIRGKPLADWLSLDELAWWLRRAKP